MQLSMFTEPPPSRPAATGDQLKRRGQKQAVDNAGREWIDAAMKELRVFLWSHKASGAREFVFETFRAFYVLKDLPPPRSPKIWGCLPRIATKAGLIEFTGRYVNASSPRTRAHPVRVWRAL